MNKRQLVRFKRLSQSTGDSEFINLISPSKTLFFLLIHVGLAILMRQVNFVSTIHAILVFIIGVYVALTAKDFKKVVPIIAYIAGAEILWRMNKANVFWEFGKYATIAILLISLLKKRRLKKISAPVVYFILFIPSIMITTEILGLTNTLRETISFNLSGPLAAAICMLYFMQIEVDEEFLNSVTWSVVYPITGILALAVISTMTATEINFGGESVFVTSGGYGPNQVSAILSLGALFLIMMAITSGKRVYPFLALSLALAMIAQSFLTFSRGGIYNLVISLTIALLILMSKPNKFIKGFFVVFIVVVIAGAFLFPELEQFTGGALSARFADLDTTNRLELAKADINLFRQHPIFGVGLGMSSYRRLDIGLGAAAHTEYTRMLAEHGSLGIIALLIMIILFIKAFYATPTVGSRAWMVAIAVWPLVEMAHAAMRFVAVPFMLGLAMVNWNSEFDQITKSIKRKK